jgi:membrane carboxypeptidase/penicillin-binding protein PbpC
MVGGIDYDEPKEGQVNVTTSARQPGSAFKPVVYAAALERGLMPSSLLWDIPYQYPDGAGGAYVPTNYDGRYIGPVRLRSALARSLNAATIGLAAEVGVPAILEMADDLGIHIDGDADSFGLSVALGAAEVRLLDLTAAYGALANAGTHAAPQGVSAVESFADREVLHAAPSLREEVLSPATAYMLTSIMSDAEARRPAFGEAAVLRTSAPSAVKTGTSNDFRDNLTIGYTPSFAVGVWAGNKDGRPMRDVIGITGAAPIWHDTMETILGDAVLLAEIGGSGGLHPARDGRTSRSVRSGDSGH